MERRVRPPDAVPWSAHRGWVWACVYHPRHDVLVSTGADGMGRVWDGVSGDLLAEFEPGGRAFHAIAFSPDGELLATFGWSGTIVVWRSTTEPLVAMTGHHGWVSSVAFHPGGTPLVSTGGADGTVRAWDVTTRALRHIVPRSDHAQPGCVFRPDADQLVTDGASGVRLWDAATWSQLRPHQELPADEVAVPRRPSSRGRLPARREAVGRADRRGGHGPAERPGRGAVAGLLARWPGGDGPSGREPDLARRDERRAAPVGHRIHRRPAHRGRV